MRKNEKINQQHQKLTVLYLGFLLWYKRKGLLSSDSSLFSITGGFLHNAKAIPTTRIAGGLFVLQSSVFRINEKLRNGEQGHTLTNNAHPVSKRDGRLSLRGI
ncbi:MAG: hypothetical protein LIP11_16865 [Clostridiales bacterium]|nr:hypothetical protein [Clostridiales bacterium]